MLKSINKYKNIVFLIGLALFAFVLFSLFLGSGSGSSTLIREQSAQTSVTERELLSTLLELKNITLNEAIFEGETFKSLEDFSQELVPEPVGRQNPFSPLPF